MLSTLLFPELTEEDAQVLTHEPELVRKHVKEPIAVHGEEDGKVNSKTTPDEEVVDGCPVARVQSDLQKGAAQVGGPPTLPVRNRDGVLRDGLIPAH